MFYVIIKKYLTLCFMLCISLVCKAQMFTNIRATETMTVRAIAQSADGCVWFSAGKSLYCFDGVGIRTIESEVLNKAGAIGCVAVEANGNVLVGCERGLAVYDGKECEAVDGFDGVNVRSIVVAKDDEWIGTSKGLYRNGELVEGNLDVISMIMNGQTLIVSCMNEMKEYDIASGRFTDVPMPPFGFVTCFYGDKDGKVMAGTVNGVFSYNSKKKKELKPLINAFPVVKCMMKDERGKLMAGCDGGLFEVGNEGVKHIVHDARNSRSLAGNVVWCMTKDKLGNLWIGTDNGLSVMTSSQDFCIYPLSAITESGKGNQVYCILHDSKDRLWMGGSNGIVKVDDFGKEKQSFAWFEMGNEVHPIPHNRIRHFYEDPVWGIWACTDGGLLHYDEEAEHWTMHPIVGDEHNWVYHVERESEALIVTTFNAVYRVKYDDEVKSINVLQRINAKPCTDNHYSSIHIGDTEWAISNNGVRISNGDESREIELPEKFVSIYYNADNELIYLGGSDVFATINPKSFAQQNETSIWFDADARFIGEDEESWLTKGLILGIICACCALAMMLVLYYMQQKRMKIERARRKAMLKSAREKMAKLENDKSSLQQQLHLQQLSAMSQNGGDVKETEEAVNLDDQFVMKVTRIVEENIDNPDLSVALLSEKLGMSSKQLYRRIKQCTGLTTVEYIRKLRLQKASLLLKNPEFTINEVMYMVGFSNPSYFSRSFASEYGMPPSEFRS